MTIHDCIIALPLIAVFIMLSYAFILYHRHQRESAKAWDEIAAQHPEEFLADNEFVFVKYKDQVFPMTALEKKERWDLWNAAEKREFYQAIMRMIRKGRGRWETTADGNRMYVDNKSKRTGLVARYNDARTAMQHRHPTLKKQMQSYVSRRNQRIHKRA